MGTFLVVIGVLLFFLGLPISVIILIVKAIQRKSLKNILISMAICFFGSFVLVGVGGSMIPDGETGEQKSGLYTEQTEDRETEQSSIEETTETEEDAEKEKAEKERDEKEKAKAEKKAKEKAKKEQEQKEKEEKANTFKYANVSVRYLKSEIKYNSFDEQCLYVYFEMTNNSDENRAFDYLVNCKAFQNGIELDRNYMFDCTEEENGSKEIQPGATIIVAEVFELDVSTEDVTLEVRPFNIWSDRLVFEKEIQITE